MANTLDPHADQPVHKAGPPRDQTAAVLILLHGRGGSASEMLDLFAALGVKGISALAPQAAGNTWYPQSFLAPVEANQPFLDSALNRIHSLISDLMNAGVSSDRIALLGFSQGACLSCEFIARNPRRYAAVLALSGGLIGPPDVPLDHSGDLADTPVFLGATDPDPHVPFARVEQTRDVFSTMHAEVNLQRYPGMPHAVNEDELDICRQILQGLF